ncbi:ribosomal protein L11 methyltransferase-domain-containing protein [Baffinella frigidus]|nr:ribosomal protein L11 methyltransferase-domain-containing protein [Cryptophyta sp. CCMP2293]
MALYPRAAPSLLAALLLVLIPGTNPFVLSPMHRACGRAAQTAFPPRAHSAGLRVPPLAASYGPIVISHEGGDALRIVPCSQGVQQESAAEDAVAEVLIDATDGWGDGHHATTRLALRFLVKHARAGQTVLDYGTGSGVCGLAAIKVGCSEALGVDIDDEVQSPRTTHS